MSSSETGKASRILFSRWCRHFRAAVSRTDRVDTNPALAVVNVMAFEGAPPRQRFGEGIKDFVQTDTRNERRKLLDGFWFD